LNPLPNSGQNSGVSDPAQLPPPPASGHDDDERARRVVRGLAIWGAVVIGLLLLLGVVLSVALVHREGDTITIRPDPSISALVVAA
jgi:hypothetical protein